MKNLVSNITTTCVPVSGSYSILDHSECSECCWLWSEVNTSGTCTPPTTTSVQSLETVSYPDQSTVYNYLPTSKSNNYTYSTWEDT